MVIYFKILQNFVYILLLRDLTIYKFFFISKVTLGSNVRPLGLYQETILSSHNKLHLICIYYKKSVLFLEGQQAENLNIE